MLSTRNSKAETDKKANCDDTADKNYDQWTTLKNGTCSFFIVDYIKREKYWVSVYIHVDYSYIQKYLIHHSLMITYM